MPNLPARKPAAQPPAVVPKLSQEEITAKLKELGMIETGGDGTFNRAKIDGGTFYLGEQMYVSNPVTKAPAFLARIMDFPVEYQKYWFTEEDVRDTGRVYQTMGLPPRDGSDPNVPSIIDRFCKSFFEDPQQARNYAEDGTSCKSCPVNPFTKNSPTGKKCAWSGDLTFQVLAEDGSLDPEAPTWTITLSTTAMMEFKGTSREPTKGHVGKFNFMQLLAQKALEGGDDGNAALYRAWTSLKSGGVIAEFRSVRTQSQDGARSYNVVQLTPVEILDVEDQPAIGDGAGAPEAPSDLDDLPF